MRRIYQERKEKGEFYLLVKDLKLFDHSFFFKYFRMNPCTYEKLLSWVGPFLKKQVTNMRESIGASERLSLTLKYLATGDAQCSIGTRYRISAAVVSCAINETCRVLWTELKNRDFLRVPNTEEDWKKVADVFKKKWNFPHALGAIDGKHITMQCPAKGGSDFVNYKKTHSIVLLGVCNGKYEFTMVDIGDSGRVYNNSSIGYCIDNYILNFPLPEKIRNSHDIFPYVFLGDDAFGLKPNILKPFPGQHLNVEERIFNYRLLRARRLIENTFGIAASRFRIFRRPIIAKVEAVIEITKAIVALHNFLMASRVQGEP